jgi:polysaccharide biosynthesis transport protein
MQTQVIMPRGAKEVLLEPEARYISFPRVENPAYQGVEWRRIHRILRRHWKVSLWFALGLEAVILIVVLALHNTYEAHSTLEIAPAVNETVSIHDSVSPISASQQDYLDTQCEILRSDYMALKVIHDLKLDQNSIFYSPSWLARGLNRMAFLRPRPSAPGDSERVEDLLKTFRRGLSVNQIKNSRLVDVAFSSTDPKLSAAINQTLVEKYLDDAHRSKYESTLKAAESLSPELNDLKQSVDKANKDLTDFQRTHEGAELVPGATPSGDAAADTTGQAMASNPIAVRVAQLNQQLTASIADRLQQQSNVRLIDQGRTDVLPQMKDNQLIQELTKRLVDGRAQLAQALAVYGGNNPQVRKLQQQAEELNTQLNAERARIAEQLKSSYRSAQIREELLRKQLRDMKGQLDASNENAVKFDLLRREAQAHSNLYLATSSRIKEMAVAGSLASNNIRILDNAQPPGRPSGPHRVQFLGAGLLVGLIGGVVLAFVAEGMDDRISTIDDVQRFSGMPALALLPASGKTLLGGSLQRRGQISGHNGKGAFRVRVLEFLKEKPHSPEAEAIRSLETAIRISAQAKGQPVKAILITSAFPGEGKTTVATNLATALSRHHKTCLIDADLRHPVITNSFGLSLRVGLQEALLRPELVTDMAKGAPEKQGLTVLGTGGEIPDAIDKMTSEAMRNLLDELRSTFEYIVIDSPPIIPFAETRWLSALADGIVVVVKCSATTRRALNWAINILEDVQQQILGVVLNGVNLALDHDGYGSAYRYYGRSAK